MFCEKCGRELPDNAQFCNFCGEKTNRKENAEIFEENGNGYTPAPYQQSGYNNFQPYGGQGQQYGMQGQPYGGQGQQYGMQGQPYGGQGQQYGMQGQQYQPYQQGPLPVQPAVTPIQKKNSLCTASFALSLIGLAVGAVIFGPLALILGVCGIVTFNEIEHNNKWMGITGICVGIIDLIVGIILISWTANLFY